MNKAVIIGGATVLVAAGAVGGILLLRNTNPKPQIPSSNENVEQPSLQVPVTNEAVEATDAAQTRKFTVDGSNFKFSPATLKVKKGDNVVITFKSNGGIHDLALDEFDVATNQLGDGEEEEVEFVADKVGTFKYYCSVDGHRKIGMEGTLTVEP